MFHRRLSQQRGQGLVEFAVIFPIFAFFLFAVIDGGLLMGRYNNVNNAAKEGARLGAVGAAQTDIVTRVKQQAHGILDSVAASGDCLTYDTDTKAICVEWIGGPSSPAELPGVVGSSVRVRVKYRYTFLTPLVNQLSGVNWDVTACAIQRLEMSVSSPPNLNAGVTACS
jgi:Flp pilus assembly protein TadG